MRSSRTKFEIGPEAGGNDQFIDDDLTAATARARRDGEASAVRRDVRSAKLALDPDPARRDQRCKGSAKFTARGQLVVCAAAECLGGIVASQHPDGIGFRHLGWRAARDRSACRSPNVRRRARQRSCRRNVRDPFRERRACHRRSCLLLCVSPMAGRPLAPAGIGRMPGAGSVDHGVGLHDLGALPVLIPDLERRGLASLGLELVEAGAADVGDAARRMDVIGEGGLGRERFKIALDQFGAGRILLWVRRIPSRRRRAGALPRGRYCIPTARTAGRGPIGAPNARCSSPASSTIGRRPRSSTWAAAASPTGPAPMIATDFASLMLFSYYTRNIEIKSGAMSCR